MYKKKLGKLGIVKNDGKKEPKRTRNRALPREQCTELETFTLTSNIGNNISSARFKPQETVIYSIDTYLGAMFDVKSKGWSADNLGFVDANGSGTNQTSMWQLLSDQCYGASTLIQSRAPAKAQTSLYEFFEGLDRVTYERDPSIMVKFWRICLELRGLEQRGLQSYGLQSPLKLFFQKLLLLFSEQHGTKNSLYLLVKALTQVPQEDFKDTLRIGYYKSINKLENMIGNDNAIVLHQRSVFFKYWDKQYLKKEEFLQKFDSLWKRVTDNCTKGSTPYILAYYYYIYAAYYICNKPVLAEGMCRNLLEDTKDQELGPNFTLSTQAIAFVSKLVAVFHRENNEKVSCHEVIDSIIGRLEKGGRECRTRAAMLSNLLARWLREWQNYHGAEQEKLRMNRIMQTIPEERRPGM